MKKLLGLIVVSVLCLSVCACSNSSTMITNDNPNGTTDNPNSTTGECEHTYGEWVVVKKASYTEAGQERTTCTKCDAQKNRDIPMLEPVVVELTTENFEKYFKLTESVEDYYERDGRVFRFGYGTVQVLCEQLVKGDLEGVCVTLEINATGGAWDKEDMFTLNLTIPATSGIASASQDITCCSTNSLEVYEPVLQVTITKAEGTITLYP